MKNMKKTVLKTMSVLFCTTAVLCIALVTMALIKEYGKNGIENTDKIYASAATTGSIEVETERRAVWFSFDDYGKTGKSEEEFRSMIAHKFSVCKKMKMTDIVVQVRPDADAMYPSKYFPWSYYASGKQGKSVSYDPLKIMVSEAHKRNLRIEAWINPYRVTLSSTDYSTLSSDNKARIWHYSRVTKHYVLAYGGQLFFNPSVQAVRTLIINGVEEIVKNYDVDGIHMDDYFYPSFSTSDYKTAFDAKQYKSYVKKCKSNGDTPSSIVAWRRENVNKLVRGVYSAVKNTNPEVEFGISPAGNIDNLTSKYKYYVDIEKWCNNTGYVDYIAPQIYWDFDYGTASFDKVLRRWGALCDTGKVRLYVGIGVYRTVPPLYGQWRNKNILKRQVQYSRKKSYCTGFYFFRYGSFVNGYNKTEIKRLKSVLK